MENKKIVVGNLKMNFTISDIANYVKVLDEKQYNKQVILCPSSLYLPYFIGKSYGCGIQNVAAYNMGEYTGEIAADQIASMNIDYAIIGHSERRKYFGETDEIVKTKLSLALNQENLKVILCIGETRDERENGKTNDVLKRQLETALAQLDKSYFSRLVVAYEPVWAIGTGKVPTNQEIEELVYYIKETISNFTDTKVMVLYGGSVNDQNIEELNTISNVDGYLVGGASKKIEKFIKIIEVVVNQ